MRSSSIAAVGVLSLSGVRIATAAPPAPLAGDPVTAIDDPAAVHAVIAEGASCIPRALELRSKAAGGELELQLGQVGGGPVLCAVASDRPLGTV